MIRIAFFILVALLTCACSKVNSMEPFDERQADIVAKDMMPARVAASQK